MKNLKRCGSSPAGLTLSPTSAASSIVRFDCPDDTAARSVAEKRKSLPPDALGKDRLTVDTLQCEWTIWFDKATPKSPPSKKEAEEDEKRIYEDCIVELGSFTRHSALMTYWGSLRCEHLKDNCNLRVFRRGVRPLSTDEENITGGKWVVRSVPKAKRAKLWEKMVQLLIHEEILACGRVTGGVLSTREEGDSLQLWVSTGADEGQDVADSLKAMIFADVQEDCTFAYQPHQSHQPPQHQPPQDPQQQQQQQQPPQPLKPVADVAPARQNDPYADTEGFEETIYSTWEGGDFPLSPTEGAKQVRGGGPDAQFIQPSYYNSGCVSPGAVMQPSCFPPSSPGQQPFAMAPPTPPQALPYSQYGTPQMNYAHMSPPQTPPLMQGQGPVISPVVSPLHQARVPVQQRGDELNRAASNLTMESGSSVPTRSNSNAAETLSSFAGEDDEESFFPGQQQQLPQTPAAMLIQERAKQIRTLKKKIRYINFYLQRQCKGRELTFSEKQRIKNLPLMQAELLALETQQNVEVDQEKRLIGVEELDYLKKSQQPMQFASESEKRYKTIRALKKKIRFIHYHLERKKQGKSLSQAEASKINALPELEQKLQELELEEARDKQARGLPPDHSGDEDTRGLAREQTNQSLMSDVTIDDESELPGQMPKVICNLQAQINAQKRQLEMRQQRIQTLMTSGGSPTPGQQPQQQQPYSPQGQFQGAHFPPQAAVRAGQPPLVPIKTTHQQQQQHPYPVSPQGQYSGAPRGFPCDYYSGQKPNIIPAQRPTHHNPMADGYYGMPTSPTGGPPPLDSPVMSPPLSPPVSPYHVSHTVC